MLIFTLTLALLLTYVVKCALRGKVMQGSPWPEVCTLTNENGRYIMKLNLTVKKSVEKDTILKKDP